MTAKDRVYWLVSPARLRRVDNSLRVEREDGSEVRIPITDVADIVACAPLDVNTAVVGLLAEHGVDVHVLGYYGDYKGGVLPAQRQVSGDLVVRQALASVGDEALGIAKEVVLAAGFNTRRVVGRDALEPAWETFREAVGSAGDREALMGAEGVFRRSAWEAVDARLPEELQLSGRSRRPPRNAGNAFISYVNGIVYSRCVGAIRLTGLHTGIGFLHSTMSRSRHTLALDLAELFKPLFAERLLLRLGSRGELGAKDFDQRVAEASLSDAGKRKVVAAVRDELESKVHHRGLGRRVSYDELLHLEALKLVRWLMLGDRYKALRVWW